LSKFEQDARAHLQLTIYNLQSELTKLKIVKIIIGN
jgi:hypothetical protein